MPRRKQAIRRSEDIPTAPPETSLSTLRRSRAVRRLLLAGLTAFVLVGATSFLGAHTNVQRGSGGGYEVTLAYPRVSRPGLAIRWILTIRHPGGFDGPVRVGTTSRYFDLFDFNNLDPTPGSATTHGELTVWEFDPPVGETLVVTLDGRIEPAQQSGRSAVTSVLNGDVPVVTLSYETRVMP
jgi:hypothetical protein